MSVGGGHTHFCFVCSHLRGALTACRHHANHVTSVSLSKPRFSNETQPDACFPAWQQTKRPEPSLTVTKFRRVESTAKIFNKRY